MKKQVIWALISILFLLPGVGIAASAVVDNNNLACVFSKTGDLVCTGDITASQFSTTCNPESNECFINVANAGPPADNGVGNCGFDNTVGAWGCWRAGGFVTYGTGSGGDNVAIRTECVTFTGVSASSDYPIARYPYNITIQGVKVYAPSGTVTGGLDECTGIGGTCGTVVSVGSDITTSGGNEANGGVLTNHVIAAGNRVFWHTASASGSPDSLNICYDYSIGGEEEPPEAETLPLNGSFEKGITGNIPENWVADRNYAGNAVGILNTTDFVDGVQSLQARLNANIAVYSIETEDFYQCVPGTQVSFSFLVKRIAGTNSATSHGFTWYKADKTPSTSDPLTGWYVDGLTADWTQITRQYNPPIDAAFFKIRIAALDYVSTILFDNVTITAGSTGVAK